MATNPFGKTVYNEPTQTITFKNTFNTNAPRFVGLDVNYGKTQTYNNTYNTIKLSNEAIEAAQRQLETTKAEMIKNVTKSLEYLKTTYDINIKPISIKTIEIQNNTIENARNETDLIIQEAIQKIQTISTEELIKANTTSVITEIKNAAMRSLEALQTMKNISMEDIKKVQNAVIGEIIYKFAGNDAETTLLSVKDINNTKILKEWLIENNKITEQELQTVDAIDIKNTVTKNSEMVFIMDDIKKDAKMLKWLEDRGYITDVELISGKLVTKKTVDGKTAFESIMEYNKENKTTYEPKQILAEAPVGWDTPVTKKQTTWRQTENKTIKFDEPIQLKDSQIKTTQPTQDKDGKFIVETIDTNGKLLREKYATESDARARMNYLIENNQEITKTLKEIVPEKTSVQSYAILKRYNQDGEKISDDIRIGARGATVEETERQLKYEIERQQQLDERKGITIKSYEIQNHDSGKTKEITILSIGGTETKMHVTEKIIPEVKQSMTGAGELLYTEQKQKEMEENKKLQEALNSINASLMPNGKGISISAQSLQLGNVQIENGKISVNGKEYYTKTIPKSYEVTDWTKTMKNMESNAPDLLKPVASTIYSLFAGTTQKLSNNGLVKETYTQGEYTNDWSLFKVMSFWGRELQSGTAAVLYGNKTIDADTAWTGNYNVEITTKGQQFIDNVGMNWANNGKVTNSIGLSDKEAKISVLEYASPNVLNNIQQKQSKDLAIMAYNPTTKTALIDAYGSTTVNNIINSNKLTQRDIENVNTDVVLTVWNAITDQRITGTPLDPFITILGGGILGIEGNVIGKVGKVTAKVGAVKDFATFIKEAKIVVPTTTGITTITDVISNTALGSLKIAPTAIIPNSGVIAKDIISPKTISEATKLKTEITELRKSLDKGITNTQNSEEFVTKLLNTDTNTARAALTEFIATTPNDVYGVISKGTYNILPENALRAQNLLESANTEYKALSNAVIENIVIKSNGNTVEAAKLLQQKSNELGKDTVNYMINTAQHEGTKYYNEITNAVNEWEKLENAGKITIATQQPPNGTQITSVFSTAETSKIENEIGTLENLRSLSASDKKILSDKTGIPINRITYHQKRAETYLASFKPKEQTGWISGNVEVDRLTDIVNAAERNTIDVIRDTTKLSRNGIETLKDVASIKPNEITLIAKKTGIDETALKLYREEASNAIMWKENEETLKDMGWKIESPTKKGEDTFEETILPETDEIIVSDELKLLGIESDGIGGWKITDANIKEMSNKEFNRLIYRDRDKFAPVIGKITKEDINKLDITRTQKDRLISALTTKKTNIADTTKITEMKRRLENETNVLADLMDEYAQKSKQKGNTSELEKLSREINKQREVVRAFDTEIGIQSDILREMSTKMKPSAQEMKIIERHAENMKNEVKRQNELIERVKNMPGNRKPSEAAKNTLDEIRKGNFEEAANKLKESNTHSKTTLLPNDANAYKDVSIAKIRRLEEYGAPQKLVDQLVVERSNHALKELATKPGMKRTEYMIRNGEISELSDEEILTLWKNERQLGLDATEDVYGKEPNGLLKRLTDDAIKSGDKSRMEKLAEEMRKEKADCVLRGECGIGSTGSSTMKTMGAGLLVAGAMTTTITMADGTTWLYDADKNMYMEIEPTAAAIRNMGATTPENKNYALRSSELGPESVNKEIVRAFDIYMKSGLPGKQYTEGNVKGIQGTKIDTGERICQNFAIEAANYINNNQELSKMGIKANVIGVIGTDVNGKAVSHVLVSIENMNKPVGSYTNPVTGKTETLYEKTLLEPQTGQTGETGTDFTGTKMMLGDSEYKIEYTQAMRNAEQSIIYGPKNEKAGITQAPTRGTDMLIHTAESMPQVDKTIEIDRLAGANETYLESEKINPFVTIDVNTPVKRING
jgi:hypothetical protein